MSSLDSTLEGQFSIVAQKDRPQSAARVLKEGPSSDEERIRSLFRLCLSREPSPTESRRLLRLLEQQCVGLAAAPEEARAIVPKELPPNVGLHPLAAWTLVARVVLNLDEFITRE